MGRFARPYAILVGGAAILALVVGTILWLRSGLATPPYVFFRSPWPMLTFVVVVTTQVTSGWLLAIRRPDLPIGPIALLFSFVISTALLVNGYLALLSRGGSGPIDPAVAAWLPSWLGYAGATLTAITLAHVFPDGRIHERRWRLTFGAACGGAACVALATALIPGPLFLYPAYDNPFPAPEAFHAGLAALQVLGLALFAVGVAGSTGSLLSRYAAADAVGRLQLRWYIATAVLLSLGFVAFIAALATLRTGSALAEIIVTLFLLAGGLPPIALVVAITRYRLYGIDVLLSRAFVFGTLTAILAGVYAASIRLFQALFVGLTGENSDAALVITTLVLATSFTPLKRRLEAFVERHFRAIEPDLPSAESPPGGLDHVLDPATIDRLAEAIITHPAFPTALATAMANDPGSPEPEAR
jgi:hypothetical protein